MTRDRTVEYEPGYGWIARYPETGEEIVPNFRWTSRSVARTVVAETRLLAAKATLKSKDSAHGHD
jgi:hypothetical protein